MKPNDFLTPSLLDIGAEIVQRTKDGYTIKRGPELLGYQYYVEFEKVAEQEAVAHVQEAVENPISMPSPGRKGAKPKKVVELTEA